MPCMYIKLRDLILREGFFWTKYKCLDTVEWCGYMPKDNGMHGTQSTVIFDILLLRNSAHECCVQIYTGYRQTATSISSFELSM